MGAGPRQVVRRQAPVEVRALAERRQGVAGAAGEATSPQACRHGPILPHDRPCPPGPPRHVMGRRPPGRRSRAAARRSPARRPEPW
ncbi:hypothetical protein [Ornithinimicrobium kibberense]|uniref:hypothetical protein n=1 Tax=Ornithinimicrobium kibberense TaxID=282060 RepID=UPI0036184E5E